RAAAEAGDVVPRIEAARDDAAVRDALADGQQIHDRQVAGEPLGRVAEDGADGRVGPAHDALDPVDRAEPVRAIDEVAAAGADKDVLAVIGDADHLVRHELTDREDRVPAFLNEEAIDLDAHREIELPLGDLADQRRGDLAERDDALAPVVDVQQLL